MRSCGGVTLQLAILGLCLLVLPSGTTAQIPTACSDANSLENLECCPVTGDGACGADAGRGQCADLDLPSGYSLETSDVRRNWPHYFTRACQCNGNFGGYDCSRCKFGYSGSDCNTKQVLPRRPVASFSDQDWAEYNDILKLTREYDSGYVVVLEDTVPGNSSLVTANTTLYQFYVWIHHYTAKDSGDLATTAFHAAQQQMNQNDSSPPIDYSHYGPAFFTWHRLFNLWLEWEIQGMLKEMGRSDYHTFRLPYWDWRAEIQSSTGITVDDLFTENRLGYTEEVGGRPIVAGSLFDNGWNTICWQRFGVTCDPREISTEALQRCPVADSCTIHNPNWPTLDDVYTAVEFDTYDSPPYNIISSDGFRNFADVTIGDSDGFEECNERTTCLCPTADFQCSVDTFPPLTFTVEMHSLGHILPGVGDDFGKAVEIGFHRLGHILDIAASPNDPYFIVHHTMLDCILDEWMERHPDEQYPDDPTIAQGHNRDDFIIPFNFPLYTNNDMFKRVGEYGYSCDLPNVDRSTGHGQPAATVAIFTWSLLLILSLIVVL